MATKFVERFEQGAQMWQTDDRQTKLRRNAYDWAESLSLQDRFYLII